MSRFSIPEAFVEHLQGNEDVLDMIYEMTVQLTEAEEDSAYMEYSNVIDQNGNVNLYVHYGHLEEPDDEHPSFEFNIDIARAWNGHIPDDVLYERAKREYIDSFISFRCQKAEEQLLLEVHGPHGLFWGGGFSPIPAHVKEANNMAEADSYEDYIHIRYV